MHNSQAHTVCAHVAGTTYRADVKAISLYSFCLSACLFCSFLQNTVYTECPENPCKNGGTCQFHAGSFLCTCAPGFTGSLCQTNHQGVFLICFNNCKLTGFSYLFTGENIRLVNDTLIGEPLMTVPIYVQSSIQQQFLCYEIHGSADDYFNLVSDQCTTVNAHYASANLHPEITIIDAITVRAVDSTQECQNIRVNLNQCAAFLGDTPLSISPRGVTVNRISVRRFRNRVRISVPNCNDSSLVMWVFCTTGSLADPASDDVFSQDMIKFVISRGLNLNERSHGLLGKKMLCYTNMLQFTLTFPPVVFAYYLQV